MGEELITKEIWYLKKGDFKKFVNRVIDKLDEEIEEKIKYDYPWR